MASKKIKIEDAGVEPAAPKRTEGLARRACGPLAKPTRPLTVGALERALLAEFPAADAEAWDRTGLLVGDPAQLVTRVAVALDPTVAAIDAAAEAGANVLLTHHPAYLNPPETFRPAPSVAANPGAGVYRAIERGVALMNFHTALDVSPRAQRVLPGMLGLVFGRVLEPLAQAPEKGYGQLCTFAAGDELTLAQLAARCTAVFGRAPRVWGDFTRPLARVVTCTGSCGTTAAAARRAGADAIVCGEVKYHDALDLSQAGLAVLDLGHDTSELPLATALAAAVRDVGVPEEQVMLIDQQQNWTYPETTRV